jgi:hypothetical protein
MSEAAPGDAPSRLGLTRRQQLLAAVGAAISAAVLFSPIRFSVDREFWERLMDAAHVPFFAALTLFLDAVLPARPFSATRRMAVAGLIAAAIAGAVELLQPHTGRGGSFIDFLNGCLGAAITVSGWHAWHRGRVLRVAHALGAGAVMLFALLPAWREWRGMQWRRAHFPLLGTFESEDEMRIWTAAEVPDAPARTALLRVREHAKDGSHSLRVATALTPWPGVRLRTGKADWSGFGALAFEVFNPGSPISLSVRITDDTASPGHDERYNGIVPLGEGWNHVRLPTDEIARGPKGRRLRLEVIRELLLFLDHPKQTSVLYLDHVRLEKKSGVADQTRPTPAESRHP